ncbi:hypothetical protein ACVOMV_01325 [Mesorhizobium atlanticum]
MAENEIHLILSEMVRQELVLHPSRIDAILRDFVVQFVVGTFLTALNWWFERKPKLSPSQVECNVPQPGARRAGTDDGRRAPAGRSAGRRSR